MYKTRSLPLFHFINTHGSSFARAQGGGQDRFLGAGAVENASAHPQSPESLRNHCSPVSGLSFPEPFSNSWELGIEAEGIMDEEWGSSKTSISLVSDLDSILVCCVIPALCWNFSEPQL